MNKLSVFTKMLCALLCLGVSQRSIAQTPEYDIAIGTADSNGLSYFEKGDFVRVGGNQYMTNHNIDYGDLKEWFWGAKIVNKGYKDILPAAHPRIRMQVDYTDYGGTTTYNVYTDTIIGNITDTIKAGDPNGIALVKYFRDIYFITPGWYNYIENYNITYWVEHDSIDGLAINDTVRHSLGITHGTNCQIVYSSKARRSAVDGKVEGTTVFLPNDTAYNALEYGAVFYFPNSWPDIVLDSIEFRYHVSNGFSGASSQSLLINIYEYTDGMASGNGFMDVSELTMVGVALAQLNGLGTIVPNGSSAVKAVSEGDFFDPAFGNSMYLTLNNKFLYISIYNNPYLFGGSANFGINDVPIVMSDEINYAMNIGMTNSAAPILPSVFIVTDSLGSNSTIHTAFDKVPSIGIYTSYCYSNINKSPTESNNLTLYPNPTTNHLNIQTTFPETTDVQYIITDITGKVYYIYNNKNSSEDIHTVDITALPAGVYLVSAKTNKGVSTEKFVKE